MDFQSEKSFGKLRLRAFQPYHQILCILEHVGDVGDRSSTPKGCNAIYVEDVEDRSNISKGCNAMCVEDVKDVEQIYQIHLRAHNCLMYCRMDVEDGKRTFGQLTHFGSSNHTFKYLMDFQSEKSFGNV